MSNTGKLAVIFDMDGVIIHSNPLITIAWRQFFNRLGIMLNDEQLKHYVFGRTSADTFNLVFNDPPDAETIRSYQHELDTHVQSLYVSQGVITPGFKPFVEELLKNNVAIAIATSAPPDNVKVVLELSGTEGYFPVITDSSGVHHSKPHPEVYLTTAARLGVPPSRCLVFEDSLSGIQAGKAAGMKVIGITTTHTAGELSAQTDGTIKDFTEMSVDKVRALLAAAG